jgi:chromosome partitioning protein
LTAVDDLDEITLGTRPTMSHATARLEMESLIGALTLGAVRQGGQEADPSREAA